MKLKETQPFYLGIKLTKRLLYQRLLRYGILREVSVSYFFLMIITLMLWRVFSEALTSSGYKHKNKTFRQKVLLHLSYLALKTYWIIHLGNQRHDSLTMAVLSFTKVTPWFASKESWTANQKYSETRLTFVCHLSKAISVKTMLFYISCCLKKHIKCLRFL